MKIEVIKLVKNYGGIKALDDISLSIIGSGIYGLLGSEGAGKTTFMRILSTVTAKTSGEIYIDGISIENKKAIRKMIGYLPREFSFYPDFTVYETLDYFAVLSGKKFLRGEIYDILERVNLQDLYKEKIKTLSKSMKKRLGIAVITVKDPQVIIADEPTAGLDKEEKVRIKNIFFEIGKDKTVILSASVAEDMEGCNTIIVLNRGNVIYNGMVLEDACMKFREKEV
ncbi:ATP-binding cassette domain-containing protein [Acidilutibacter cellobiosedens]|uniref:ATP-binding cassette domain-containing protein n=1 Tax=Acidilutibacter cellobiosedens TaxID=2507161 RepID=A0A410QCC8_9FIRM|nr:ATP-binding cassette domain-containing protein [Acidilutibacter cellobiosedens]QAT61683.1 ATP-binding cassette domain-containing protein [Acidilutibacter cellobiosedens]